VCQNHAGAVVACAIKTASDVCTDAMLGKPDDAYAMMP